MHAANLFVGICNNPFPNVNWFSSFINFPFIYTIVTLLWASDNTKMFNEAILDEEADVLKQ